MPPAFEVFEQNEDLFSHAGFQVRAFGNRTVLLEGAKQFVVGNSLSAEVLGESRGRYAGVDVFAGLIISPLQPYGERCFLDEWRL